MERTALRAQGRLTAQILTWGAGISTILALSACWTFVDPQENGGPELEAGTGGTSGGSGGASGTQGPIGGAAGTVAVDVSSYRVDVRADKTSLCPGQCTTVTADVVNGTPPFAFEWNQTGMDGEGPFEVCPSTTTSYEVTATDSFSTLEEFGGDDREATGVLEIVVAQACEPVDGGIAPPQHVEPGQPTCELRVASMGVTSTFWPVYSSGAQSSVAVDAQGNAYFIASMSGGPVQIGNTSIQPSDQNVDGAVVKLSPRCEPIWVRALPPLSGTVAMKAIVVSPSGDDIYVAGNLEGSATFAGETFNVGGNNSGFVLKLDGTRDGEIVWAKAAIGETMTTINDLALAEDGDVIVTGFGLDGVTFAGFDGSAPDTSYSSFVARVRPDGTGAFLNAMSHASETLTVATLDGGRIALMGLGSPTVPLELGGGVIDVDLEKWSVFVAVLEANGDFVWGRSVRTIDERWTWLDGTTMTVDRDGQLLIDECHYVENAVGTLVSTRPELIRLDQFGNEVWSRARSYARSSESFWMGGLAADGDGDLLVLDMVLGGVPTDDDLTFMTTGTSDIVLSKRTADGDPIWFWQTGGPLIDSFWGVATDPQGAIWVGSGRSTTDTGTLELVVTRIAP